MSWVFSAFVLSYGLFEIPTGWWGDRVGARRILTRIVVWWSAFTVLTGAVVSYWQLLLTRFLFGAGEAGAWPNVAIVFARWIPQSERGTAQGLFFSGAHAAAGLTPILVATMLYYFHWRMLFVIFGAIGFVWALRVVPVVPRHAARALAGQRCRARAHRGRHDGPDPPRFLAHALEAAARQSIDRVPVPDVLHPGLRLLPLHHLDADVPPRVTRVPGDRARVDCRPADDAQRRGRPGRRRLDRPVRSPVRQADRPRASSASFRSRPPACS